MPEQPHNGNYASQPPYTDEQTIAMGRCGEDRCRGLRKCPHVEAAHARIALRRVTAERDRYRAALAHYADEATWMDRGDHDEYADPTNPGWLRAHEALHQADADHFRDDAKMVHVPIKSEVADG